MKKSLRIAVTIILVLAMICITVPIIVLSDTSSPDVDIQFVDSNGDVITTTDTAGIDTAFVEYNFTNVVGQSTYTLIAATYNADNQLLSITE
jgi:hypothetical protein